MQRFFRNSKTYIQISPFRNRIIAEAQLSSFIFSLTYKDKCCKLNQNFLQTNMDLHIRSALYWSVHMYVHILHNIIHPRRTALLRSSLSEVHYLQKDKFLNDTDDWQQCQESRIPLMCWWHVIYSVVCAYTYKYIHIIRWTIMWATLITICVHAL